MSGRKLLVCAAALAAAFATMHANATCQSENVARETLSNGLRVVVVRNTLAPVVTTVLNYEAGSDEQSIPGLAHAVEHMMFRGSATLSSSALMDAVGVTGGDFDADTESTVTQYYFTVPSAYLDIALRAERSRATGLLLTQGLWNAERAAITQEVTQDNSDAFYRLFVKMQNRLIGGTPYAKNTLGTVTDFARSVDSAQLRKFYAAWYHPNNAVYVISGDVDPQETIARVRELFGDLPPVKLPARPAVILRPVHRALYHDRSDQAFTAVALGYRFPGYDSSQYAAGQILADVLENQRSEFGGLAYTGRVLATEFYVQPYPKTGIALAFVAVPVSVRPQTAEHELRAILDRYRKTGVPNDLVEAAKLREISQLEFEGNSIEGQALEWSQAVAVQGLSSPQDMIAQFEAVNAAEVDRVLRTYVDNRNAVVAYAVPKNSGASNSGGEMAKENNQVPPTSHEPLPDWARSVLTNLSVPQQTISPADVRLANGMRLIVQPEHATQTVVVAGEIENEPGIQEPQGKEGVADLTAALLPYGTTTYDRIGLQTQLDEIAGSTDAGTEFGLDVLSSHFERGLQLLADEELHPAFGSADFSVVRDQSTGALVGEMRSPEHLAAVAASRALYPAGDPTQRFATPASVKNLTLADVKTWYATAYRPDLTTVVVIGDTTPETAKALFERYFGAWTAVGPKPDLNLAPVPPNRPAAIHVPATGRVQSSVQLIETTPLVSSDPAWAPLQVANTVLTGGFFSSLLYHDLREVHGYAYSIDSTLDVGKTRSTFALEYGCDPRNILPAQSEIAATLLRLTREPIDAERLLRAKALLMGEVPIREASYDGVTEQLLDYAALDLPLNQSVIDAQAELTATPESVREAVEKYVRPSDFVRVVTGPGPR
jgi:zinc protease